MAKMIQTPKKKLNQVDILLTYPLPSHFDGKNPFKGRPALDGWDHLDHPQSIHPPALTKSEYIICPLIRLH